MNAKMIPVETSRNRGEEGIRERGGRGEFKYYMFDTL
jgi:hypothetical protein